MPDATGFGMGLQPNSVSAVDYRPKMSPEDMRALVWTNVQTLMKRRYGGDNVTRLGKDTGIKQGGAQRLKMHADVGVGILARVATFFEIDAWQLIAPNLGEAMRLSAAELEAVRKLREPTQPKGDWEYEKSPKDRERQNPLTRKKG